MADGGQKAGRLTTGRLLRSLRVQGTVLLLVLLALPVLLYSLLAERQGHQRELLVTAVRDAGSAIAAGLAPDLGDLRPDQFGNLNARLERFADSRRSIVVLFHPAAGAADQGFFFVASAPAIAAADVARERDQLAALGVLPALARSCQGGRPLAERVGRGASATAVITSISAVPSEAGCWAVVIAVNAADILAGIDDRPFWHEPEVQAAFAVYAAMSLLILLVFASIRANLTRFRRLALAPSPAGSFAAATDVPEMAPVAHAIDAMVRRLRGAADVMRHAAEDNAHAFKGPIAVIRQAVEPLTGGAPPPERVQAALVSVAAALDRLDGLVGSARRLDAAAADLLVMPDTRVDLAPLLDGLVVGMRAMDAGADVTIVAELAETAVVRGEAGALESIFENLLDNAIGFSPPGGMVRVRLATAGGLAVVTVDDNGPGVSPVVLPRMFERYYSDRRAAPPRGDGQPAHFGIGLWLARQNVWALGGEITAENRAGHGLTMRVTLKLADPATRPA
jgi:two-component system sensor histidine kinase ChvG